jgi:low temperature requirement protein LtrA
MLRAKPWRVAMVGRDRSEQHRQASWLELFFDLSFVVAVAQAAIQLEHAFAEGHPGEGILGFLIVFAAIWWAWMAFTWFANVFDTDDVPYRLLMFVIIAGSLGLAAGVPRLFALDFSVGVISYVVIRLAYVGQWIRVYRSNNPIWKPVALRIIALTTFVQAGWVLFLWMPSELQLVVLVIWFAVDLATPYFAGWDARMGGHRHHIVERYGLFTIIVLGESIAAATVAIGEAVSADVAILPLLILSMGGLVMVCSLWWIYFDFSSGRAPERSKGAQYFWGYAHYFVFAALAAIGAGLALSVVWTTNSEQVAIPAWAVSMLVGAAVAVFLVTIALIEGVAERNITFKDAGRKLAAAALVIGAALTSPVLSVSGAICAIALVLAVLVVGGVVIQHRLHRETELAEK